MNDPSTTTTTTNPYGGHAALFPHPSSSSSTPFLKPQFPTLHRALYPSCHLLNTTLPPTLTLNAALAGVAYTAGRLTDRLETKDIVWPLAPVLSAWWAAVLRHSTCPLVPFRAARTTEIGISAAWRGLSGAEKALLGGVTVWGGRLFYKIVRRAVQRQGGGDDPRYEARKKELGVGCCRGRLALGGGFWNWAWLTEYLPEALVQSVIALPVTVPFRLGWGEKGVLGMGTWSGVGNALAAGLFSAGLVLEALADWQLEEFGRSERGEGKMCREGVWGIVRHPNYLGDVLVHLSFPIFLYANNMLAPITLLGPLANYLFLRFVGGDKETEESQRRRYNSEGMAKKVEFDRYRRERNAFWPDAGQIYNKWTWVVVGCGVTAGVLAESLVRRLF